MISSPAFCIAGPGGIRGAADGELHFSQRFGGNKGHPFGEFRSPFLQLVQRHDMVEHAQAFGLFRLDYVVEIE
jgi:hypothetical protein